MRNYSPLLLLSLLCCSFVTPANGQPLTGSVPEFEVAISDLVISQEASASTYFDQTGRKFAILGTESGEFEAWAWPLKLFVNFNLSFFIGTSTQPIEGRDIAKRIDVRPDVTTFTYVYQSFTAKAHVIVPPNEAGALVLLDIDSTEPLSVVVSFVPTMQPMWPAGLGGQYARWDDGAKAYLISESSRKNHGYLGSPAGETMSYTPAHMLGENPNQFKIEIQDPASVEGQFIPIGMAGGKGERESVRAVYDAIVASPQQWFMESYNAAKVLRQNTVSIQTPQPQLDAAFEWAKFSYDGLFADNPDFSATGMMAGLAQAGLGGRPGFGWFFGGDSYLNSLSLNALGAYGLSQQAITFMAPFQREDGKMPHEITQAVDYVDWFTDYPYAFIHADTSPYFVLAMHAYFERTGNWEAIQSQWDTIVRAFAWSKQTDLDGDGLMDNEAAGLGALEFGALTGIQTDIYLGAVWIQAIRAMNELASVKGDSALAEETRQLALKAEASFEKFWDEEVGQYVYAFNKTGETVSEVTPWSAVGLMFGDGTDERATSTLRRMHQSDLTTDWGVRMLSTSSSYYEPLNYNYGAVWPFLTSWVTTAQFKRGLPLQAYSNLMASVGHVFERSLGDITEVFSGARHTWPQESVPHQGFCTAATVLPTIKGLFGLDYSAPKNQVSFSPAVPADWNEYRVSNVAIQLERLSFTYARSGNNERYEIDLHAGPEIKCLGLDYESTNPVLRFSPTYQPGTRVVSVTLDGKPVPFETIPLSDTVQILSTIQLTPGKSTVEVQTVRSLEIVPPEWNSQVGDENKGLRILDYKNEGRVARITLEGRSGKTYPLGIRGADLIDSVKGGVLLNEVATSGSKHRTDVSQLIIEFPRVTDSEFSVHTVTISLK